MSMFWRHQFLVRLFLRRKKQLYEGQDKTYLESANVKNIQQSLSGIKEIKLLKLENYFLNIFKLNINKICNYEFKHQFIASIPRLILELTALAIFILGFLIYSIKSFDQIINVSRIRNLFVLIVRAT